MYNTKDIQFAGKYDYDKGQALKFASWGGKSFSVGIFKWVLKSNGKELKRSAVEVRVSGSTLIKEKIFAECESIVNDLDNVSWDGRKTVSVR